MSEKKKWDYSGATPGPDEWKAEEFPRGCVIPAKGNSDDYNVGGWRSDRPIHDDEACIQCLLCFIYCPDSAVVTENGKVVGFDYDHCKGCGICANECPTNPKLNRSAIEMVPEGCELKVEEK